MVPASIPVSVALAALLGAVPLELPPTERVSDWSRALEVGGMEPGKAIGEGPWVRLEPSESGWTLVVHDTAGELHRVGLDRPEDQVQREATVFLAASLVHPIELPDMPAPAADEPRPDEAIVEAESDVPAPPRPRPATTPATTPSTMTGPPPAVVDVPTAPLPTREPPLQPWARVVAGVAFRIPRDPMPLVGVTGGVRTGAWRAGVDATWVPSVEVGGVGHVWTLDLGAVGGWEADHLPLSLEAGVGAGRRTLTGDQGPAAAAWVPVAWVQAAARASLSRHLAIEPYASLRQDLRAVDLQHDLGPTTRLGSFSLQVGVALATTGW